MNTVALAFLSLFTPASPDACVVDPATGQDVDLASMERRFVDAIEREYISVDPSEPTEFGFCVAKLICGSCHGDHQGVSCGFSSTILWCTGGCSPSTGCYGKCYT